DPVLSRSPEQSEGTDEGAVSNLNRIASSFYFFSLLLSILIPIPTLGSIGTRMLAIREPMSVTGPLRAHPPLFLQTLTGTQFWSSQSRSPSPSLSKRSSQVASISSHISAPICRVEASPPPAPGLQSSSAQSRSPSPSLSMKSIQEVSSGIGE